MVLVTPLTDLSLISSISICFVFCASYLLALYLLAPADRRYERNHSDVIVRRISAVIIVCWVIYLFFTWIFDGSQHVSQWLGFRTNVPSIFMLIFCPTILTFILYLGPIAQNLYNFDGRFDYYHARHILRWSTNEKLIFLRNYFFAPFTEEFVYRSAMILVLYPKISSTSAIFLSPLFFGLAHLHHMLEHFHQNAKLSSYAQPSSHIVLTHLFQFSYTYVFGVYSAFLFIRTGHFIPSFLTHAICNGFGLPNLTIFFNRHDPDVKNRLIFAVLYLLGLFLFFKTLFFFTQWNFYYTNRNEVMYVSWFNRL